MSAALPTKSLADGNWTANAGIIRGKEQPIYLERLWSRLKYFFKPTWLELLGMKLRYHLLRHFNLHSEALRIKSTWSSTKTSLSNRCIQSWARRSQSSGHAITFWKMEPLPVFWILLPSQDETAANNICTIKCPRVRPCFALIKSTFYQWLSSKLFIRTTIPEDRIPYQLNRIDHTNQNSEYLP